MKSTDCNANMVWPQVGFPKHCRSARRAKMHPNLSSLLPVADIDVGRSFGANMFLLVEGNNAEQGTGSPLKRPLKRPDRVYPLGKNQEYACHDDWEDRPG
jgi:hypothetical protein